jgi:hypothetical protein
MEVKQLDAGLIVSTTGLSLAVIDTIMQSYTFFKKSNVEQFFDILLDSKKDLTSIGNREDLSRYFFSIIDEVAKEANQEKIKAWKNAVIRLATDFSDFGFKDNFVSALASLTVWDLTVLFMLYSTEYQNQNIMPELLNQWEHKGIKQDMVIQAVKHLASHNLTEEVYWLPETGFVGPGHEEMIYQLQYMKNELGKEFLKFISESDS